MSKLGAILVGLALAAGCRPGNTNEANVPAKPPLVRVAVLAATPTTMERTTTQPAIVHAYYQAHIFAKASGYLTQLKCDIGATVKQGDVLAVIDIPELSKRREAQRATIRRLEAQERSAASQLAVAHAALSAYGAKLKQAQAELGKAEAGLRATQVDLDRAADLVRQRAVAERLRDEAQKQHEIAEAEKAAAYAVVSSAESEVVLGGAQRDSAEVGLEVAKTLTEVARRELDELDELMKYATLASPFDGLVTQRNVDLGDLVRDAQTDSSKDARPLFTVAKVDQLRVRVPVPERDAPFASVGDAVRISLQAFPGEVFDAKISRLSGVLDDMTRSMLVEIDLPNPDGRIRPGMFGQATITLEPSGATLALPANVVRFDEEGGSHVYVVNASNTVEVVDVQTGQDDGQQIEITAGLTGDERIVGPLLRRLKPQQRVEVEG